ncbi:MAG: PfkB family carbohydrate kinase, partial [Bacteroidota bacterium]
DIIEIFNYELNTENLFVTKGKSGAIYTDGNEVFEKASFKTEILDTIGAGDTFFAFASLSSVIKSKEFDKLLIPSLSASLSTTWLCNEKSVTKKLLQEHAAKYL